MNLSGGQRQRLVSDLLFSPSISGLGQWCSKGWLY
jgi:hypothetical protein